MCIRDRAYVLLPWYFPQDMPLLKALPGIFGGAETASGLVPVSYTHLTLPTSDLV